MGMGKAGTGWAGMDWAGKRIGASAQERKAGATTSLPHTRAKDYSKRMKNIPSFPSRNNCLIA